MGKRRFNFMTCLMGLASIGVTAGMVYAFTGDRNAGAIALASANTGQAAVDSQKSSQPTANVGKSGLPLPRFVSLKRDKVNVRRGPSSEHAVAWVFTQKGRPVEIVAEFEHWRRIRDADGQEGWVYHTLLQGRRMVLIAPWAKDQMLIRMFSEPSKESALVARVSGGAMGTLKNCDGKWCRLQISGHEGFMDQAMLWGAYPNERIN